VPRHRRRVTRRRLDFGISKRAEDNAVNVTRTQSSLGTPLYMSPEQTRSTKHVDARTDVWAMGVILYELLSGDVPFKGETPGQVAVSVAVDKVVPLRSYRPELPEGIEAVIAGALAKDANDRYPTIRAFALALAPFALGTDVTYWSNNAAPTSAPGQRPPFESAAALNLETATTLNVHKASPATGRKSLWLGGAVATGVVLVAGALAIAASQQASVAPANARKPRDAADATASGNAVESASAQRAGAPDLTVTPTAPSAGLSNKEAPKPSTKPAALPPSGKPISAPTTPTTPTTPTAGPLPTRL